MPPPVSPLTLNRLSVYLRALRQLEDEGIPRVSSAQLAERYRFSAAQIRKDFASLGEFGIRGVGYDVAPVAARLGSLLCLDRPHPVLVVGLGNLGSALARHIGFTSQPFRVAAIVDADPQKIGRRIGNIVVRAPKDLRKVVRETAAQIAILTVPANVASETYLALVAAGVRAVLNFTPVRLDPLPQVKVKQVDLRILVEELAYFLR
jgi:redox-sensing transcriptional repressor